jgi:protein phosphatase
MFVCPRCSAENPQDNRFCQQCGLKLVRRLAIVFEKPLETGEPTDPQVDGGEGENSLTAPTGETDLRSRYRVVGETGCDLATNLRLLDVLDGTPQQNSALQEFILQQPIVDGAAYLGKAPTDYPEWDLWDRCGVISAARPYLALQPALPSIPQLCDAWEEYGRSVVVIENSRPKSTLAASFLAAHTTDGEANAWLQQTLRLWGYLEPWSVRASLLDINNLGIAEDRSLYLRCLIPEEEDREKTLDLKDLVEMWQQLARTRWSNWADTLNGLLAEEHLTVEQLSSSLREVQDFSGPLSSDVTDSLINPYRLLNITAAATTDVGQQRDHNEDCYSIETTYKLSKNPQHQTLEGRGLYILCDGMGGHAAGEVASSMTIEKLQEYWATHWHDHLPSEETIMEAIGYANQAVFEINQANASAGSGRMGTTLVMVMVQDHQVAIAHVGDSRCYLLEESSSLVQVTTDHEVGQRDIARGIEPEIAYGRPDAYQLTQAIGPRAWESISPDVQFFGLRENTLILIASDGLTDRDLLEEHGEELLRPLITGELNLDEGVQKLVDFGNSYNGHDNITAIAVHLQVGK